MGLSNLLKSAFLPSTQKAKDTRISLVLDSAQADSYTIVDEIIDFKYKSSIDSFTLIEITIPFEVRASTITSKEKAIDKLTKAFKNEAIEKKLNAFTEIFIPFSFRTINIYYDDFSVLMMRGTLLNSVPTLTEFGYVLNITISSIVSCFNDMNFYSFTNSYEFVNATLEKIVKSLIKTEDPPVFIPSAIGQKYRFDKVALEPTQTVYDFFINLVQSERILITDGTYEVDSKIAQKSGCFVFHKIEKKIASCFLEEGKAPFLSASPSFNPQQFFAKIVCLVPTTAKSSTPSSSINPKIFDLDSDEINVNASSQNTTSETKNKRGEYPKGQRHVISQIYTKAMLKQDLNKHSSTYSYRVHVFKAEAEKNKTINADKEAKAKYGRMLANSVNYQVVVQGHKNPKTKKLFAKGDFISVYAPHSAIMQPTTFIIKNLELNRTVSGGDTTTMTLALPESYYDTIDIPATFSNLPFIKNDVNAS